MLIPRAAGCVLATVLIAGLAPHTATATPAELATRRPAKPVLVAPDSVTEGDRFTVSVRIAKATTARRVQLEQLTTDLLGNRKWEAEKAARVAGHRKRTFKLIATEASSGTYRARVTYRDGSTVVSRPSRTTVWQWRPLWDFDQYYATSGVWTYNSSFAINGTQYRGWSAYVGSYPSWEGRFTLGRHCRALRGVMGVTDTSADGSSVTIALVADDTNAVYQSPSLTPGMSHTFQVDLPLPYRLSIQAKNTSPEGVRVYPAIGTPEVLCTGL